jgi:hypothetical protein
MNRATRLIVAMFGVLLGLGGLDHGFFETLQGNTATHGLFVQSIGVANRMWLYGTEDAFTLIPNFLITGLLAIALSLLIVVWSVGFIHRPHGSLVLLLLCVLLFLVGGGVAQIVFVIMAWAVATQINQPLNWWRKVLPKKARGALAPLWRGSLAVGTLLFLCALEIAVAGFVPGVADPAQKQTICWSLLVVALVAFLLTIVEGFADDIRARA